MSDIKEAEIPERTSEDRWVRRRFVIYVTLLFCGFVIIWLIFNGEDTRLNDTIANGVILLASSVIIAYVGGSAYEDTRMRKESKFR